MTAVVTGALLVGALWVALLGLVLGWGLWAALASSPVSSRATVIRRSLWFGLALGSAMILCLSLTAPLSSAGVAGALVGSAVLGACIAWWQWRKRTWPLLRGGSRSRFSSFFAAGLAVSQIVLAFAVLGPVTNYDTGLYHLGAIAYGSEFGSLPGVSNLYGPLGYSTLEFAWASALTTTPLEGDGFRLLNGFLMLLLAVEAWLRLRRLSRVGDYFLLVSLVAMWGPMLGMADFWIASPTQDAAALVLTLAMSTYFVDAVAGSSGWKNDAWLAILLGAMLVAVRTTMIIYVGAALVVLGVLALRRRYRFSGSAAPLVVGGISAVIGAAMLARDYILSGWLLYPLSVLPTNAPWLSEDPEGLRQATLGFHRDPANISGALEGWDWVAGWATRLPGYWETYLVMLLGFLLIVGLIFCRIRNVRLHMRPLLLSTAPAGFSVVVWFAFSPPTFRFVWGPLVALFAIPLAWIAVSVLGKPGSPPGIEASGRSLLALAGALVLIVAAGMSILIRIPWSSYTEQMVAGGPIPLSYVVAPVPSPDISFQQVDSGLRIAVPTTSDQCWAEYPLCSPSFPATVALRGADLSGGFTR